MKLSKHVFPWVLSTTFLLSGNLWSQPATPAANSPQTPTETAQRQSPTTAQLPQQTTESIPALKVTTRLVMLTVVARDKKGQVVPDLQQPDFQIKEDGKNQRVSVFSFQSPMAGEALPLQPAKLPPNVFRNSLRYQPNRALNVILLDALNTNLLNQAYVRIEMIKFLDKIPQGQPVAIFTMGRKLRMVQDFTTDLTELKRVIRTFKGESSHALISPTGTPEVPMTLQGWAEQTAIDKAPQLKAQIENFADQAISDQSDIRIQYTMSALTSLARMLAGYPGRKNLIWLTESIPFGVFPDIKPSIRQTPGPGQLIVQGAAQAGPPPPRDMPSNARRQYADQIALIGNQLADAQVSVYPVDARGLIGLAFNNVANNMSGQQSMSGQVTKAEGRQSEELFQAHYNMREIAEKTGGMAFYNRNDLDVAVRTGMDDGSTYYTIGYYPDNKDWNGRFRKIQLSVNRPGVKLRYRLGYFAVDRNEYDLRHPEQRDLDFSQALNPDYPVSTAVQFEVGIVPPGPGETKIKINYALDPHLLSFEKSADGLQRAQVDCAVRVFTPKNIERPVRTEATRINASLKPEVYDKIGRTYFPCQLIFDLDPGKYLLRLAVRDNKSGLLGTVNAEFTMPDMKAAATTGSH